MSDQPAGERVRRYYAFAESMNRYRALAQEAWVPATDYDALAASEQRLAEALADLLRDEKLDDDDERLGRSRNKAAAALSTRPAASKV